MTEEIEEACLDRLGRQRPSLFKARAQEHGFVFAVVIVAKPSIAESLSIPSPSTTWPANACSLVVSTFYHHSVGSRICTVLTLCMWKVVCTLLWSLIAGFSYNEIMLDVCRAMQGLGPAAFLPASMSLMGIINRSGPPNNLVFSIDGAMAPLGFFVGIFFAGLRMATSYIIATMVVGVVFLALAVYVEGWVAEAPSLPFDKFKVECMKPLILAFLLTYGSAGIYLVMEATPMQLVAWWPTTALGGCIIDTVGGFVLHRISEKILMIMVGIAWVISPLLFALAPSGANHWAWVFPAMICCTLALDATFNVTKVFISTSMPMRRQGLAEAVINSLLQLSIAVALGVADNVVAHTSNQSRKQSLKNAFWCELALAALSLVIIAGFVKLEVRCGEKWYICR
ncbi:major facilitator superfamily domain-containing protein [Delphinella strobiligena]|nr:major facilitator superfamily domain-containing protein [Delphinella strobiligena]